MENTGFKTYWIPVLSVVLLFLIQNTFAMAPEGHPESLDSELHSDLNNRMEQKGYVRVPYRQELSRAISAYLWDNRDWLISTDFSKARQADVMVCLMAIKGYSEFDKYVTDIKDWCDEMVRVPVGHDWK